MITITLAQVLYVYILMYAYIAALVNLHTLAVDTDLRGGEYYEESSQNIPCASP